MTLYRAGDQANHLLWRLRNGEIPPTGRVRLAVLFVGTNDLGVGFMTRQGDESEQAVQLRVAQDVVERCVRLPICRSNTAVLHGHSGDGGVSGLMRSCARRRTSFRGACISVLMNE